MIVLEGLGAIGAMKGMKMNGKIFGISILTIILVVVAYLAGSKFPSLGNKALGVIGQ